MAFTKLGEKAWGSNEPLITVVHHYEMKREGANMLYRVKMEVLPMGGTRYFGYPIYMTTSLDGSVKEEGKQVKAANPGTWSSNITYTSGWMTVSNKTTGTTALTIKVYSGLGSSRSGTYKYTLPIEPAASTLHGVGNFIIEDGFSASITKENANFNDILTVSLGDTVIKTIDGVSSGQHITFTSDELSNIYSRVPGYNATFAFTLTTKSGDDTVGSSSCTAIGTIHDNIRPSIHGINIYEAGSVPGDWGIFVKTKSRLRFVINASPGSGSHITDIWTSIDGVTYNGSDITTNVINSPGDIVARITVKDARGRTTEDTRAIYVHDYAKPWIESLQAFRSNSSGSPDDGGSFINLHVVGGVYDLDGKNTNISYKIQWKKTSDSNYNEHYFSSNNEGTQLTNIETGSSYHLRAAVTDYFNNGDNTIYSNVMTISSVFRTINLKPGGRAVGIGKIAENDNRIEMGLPVEFYEPMVGPVNFANNTWNNMGDDCAIGDCNAAGLIGLKGLNGNTGIAFHPCEGNAGNVVQNMIADGYGGLHLSNNLAIYGDLFISGNGTPVNQRIDENKNNIEKIYRQGTPGTNWLIDALDQRHITKPSENYNSYWYANIHPLKEQRDGMTRIYTLSFRFIPENWDTNNLPAQQVVVGGVDGVDAWAIRLGFGDPNWKVHYAPGYHIWSYTFEIPGDGVSYIRDIGFLVECVHDRNACGYISHVKLEEGPIATAWTPSPFGGYINVSDYASNYSCIHIGDLQVAWGRTSITPTAAGEPTRQDITFPKQFRCIPAMIVTPNTRVPATQVTGWGYAGTSTTGTELWVTRNNTTATNLCWVAIGQGV